jgi:hypothetical protein
MIAVAGALLALRASRDGRMRPSLHNRETADATRAVQITSFFLFRGRFPRGARRFHNACGVSVRVVRLNLV